MYLNKKGLGILYGIIVLIALIFVIYNIMELTKINKKEITYYIIEKNIKEATEKYIDRYYKNDINKGTITVTSSNLIKYNLLTDEDLITSKNDVCKGYGIVTKNNNLDINSYIQCDNYETINYQNWRLGE